MIAKKIWKKIWKNIDVTQNLVKVPQKRAHDRCLYLILPPITAEEAERPVNKYYGSTPLIIYTISILFLYYL
jgi:hypothetical protein